MEQLFHWYTLGTARRWVLLVAERYNSTDNAMERPAWTITFGVFRFFTSFVFVCGVFYWWNAEDGLNTNASLYFFIWLIWIDFGLVLG